ncbi:hypothetical protein K458DRAFT_22025 [Lentithecium fluviatile CBS 122367]|uniref:Uncharacterized protein n=1 Tax=Lentithecium fluviatile CBS 122367 TaxID=1168545 RepID=A0A6G1J3Z9_9PLEO|nr:hypothetical protein K458DRAFT_22025 [Lentithecium fluviatile CBS 122367]
MLITCFQPPKSAQVLWKTWSFVIRKLEYPLVCQDLRPAMTHSEGLYSSHKRARASGLSCARFIPANVSSLRRTTYGCPLHTSRNLTAKPASLSVGGWRHGVSGNCALRMGHCVSGDYTQIAASSACALTYISRIEAIRQSSGTKSGTSFFSFCPPWHNLHSLSAGLVLLAHLPSS